MTDGRPTARPTTLRGKPSLSLIGLLAVEVIIGYEWFISGLVKFVRGGFPAGLAQELVEKSDGAAAWYVGFLNSAVIPNAVVFGYLIEAAELLAGVVLILGPVVWLFAWDRIPDRLRTTILILITLAALGGAFLAINLHLANGASHPWLIPGEAFDEGIGSCAATGRANAGSPASVTTSMPVGVPIRRSQISHDA